MAKSGGWTGKILRVDLSTGKITTEDTSTYKDYIGGSGLAYKVLWDEVAPGTDAWDPENRVVFGVGPLTGTGSPLSGRVSVTSLWPASGFDGVVGTLPATGHMGGHWGPELKYAGYDSVIVQGQADKPVWLHIQDDKVTLKDASRLWGNGIRRATTDICAEIGDANVLAIGQAGENLVRLSNVMCDRSHSAGGVGSVLGAKNLKAIAVQGSGSIPIAADRQEWHELVYEYLSLVGANSGGVVPRSPQPWAEFYGNTRWTARKGLFWGAARPPLETGECPVEALNKMAYRTHKGVLDHGDAGEKYTVRMGGCQACPIRCHVMTDVPALEEYGVSRYQVNTCSGNSFGRGFYPGSAVARGSDRAVEVSQLGVAMADDYGLWNDYGQMPEDFLYAFESGLLEKYLPSEEYAEIAWDQMESGDPAFVQDIMRRITFKEGELGDALAGGPALLEARWPEMKEAHNTEYDLQQWKMGHHRHHSIENGGQVGALINLIYNRDPMCHTHTNFMGNGLPLELQKEIGAEIVGTPDAFEQYHNYGPMNEGKAKFVALSLIYMELHNSLTSCNYTLPTWASPWKDRNYRGDPDMEAKNYAAVTGEQVSQAELNETGAKMLALFRALTARQMNEIDQRNEHDLMPDWIFDYDQEKAPFDPGTDRMDRDDMELAKDMLYAELGWDTATGMPTRATLEKLNLKDVADELDKLGLLPA
jgi:aldehyde:ferredoxin oxidoreductase